MSNERLEEIISSKTTDQLCDMYNEAEKRTDGDYVATQIACELTNRDHVAAIEWINKGMNDPAVYFVS